MPVVFGRNDRSGSAERLRLTSTTIEQFVYGDSGNQGVIEFAVSEGVVRLRLAPWEGPKVITAATFADSRLTSVEAYPDEIDDLHPPWDVIGFDCSDQGAGRWGFVLHCASIEWCFEATWPAVERSGT